MVGCISLKYKGEKYKTGLKELTRASVKAKVQAGGKEETWSCRDNRVTLKVEQNRQGKGKGTWTTERPGDRGNF